MNEQQKLFCVIFDEISLEYIKDLMRDMSVKGEDTLIHSSVMTCLKRNDPWPNVVQSLREQFKKESEIPVIPTPVQ